MRTLGERLGTSLPAEPVDVPTWHAVIATLLAACGLPGDTNEHPVPTTVRVPDVGPCRGVGHDLGVTTRPFLWRADVSAVDLCGGTPVMRPPSS